MSTVPTPTTALTLDEINPASFDFWLRDDVEGALAKLRHERPVAWHQHPDSGKGFWSLTRFDDVAAATRDWETFSSAYGIQVMIDPEDMQYLGADPLDDLHRSPEAHQAPERRQPRLHAEDGRQGGGRRSGSAPGGSSTPSRPKGEVEFVSEVSAALPVAIICDMMGVPEADRPQLLDLTNRLLAGGDAEFGGHARSPSCRRRDELRDYGLWLG